MAQISESGPPRFHVGVQVFDEFDRQVSHTRLARIGQRTLELAFGGSLASDVQTPADAATTMGVVVADDAVVRDLNGKHRGLDEITDVLAFSFLHQGEYHGDGQPQEGASDDGDFVLPPGESAGLGEVIISYPQAVRQALESGHTVRGELARLLVHGILHLLGYDHVEPEEEADMKAREAGVLAQVLEDE